jgi:hypothetical protein
MVRCASGVISLAFVVLLAGCAGNVAHMDQMDAATPAPSPDSGKAMVVFLRPSGLGFAVQSTVYDVSGNKAEIVGVLPAKARVAYQVTPGEHLFMTVGENAEFMSADLAAGKTYYAKVEPRMGAWKARFVLTPVSTSEAATAEFQKDLDDCKWVAKNQDTEAWFAGTRSEIESKRSEYYSKWASKPESERARLLRDYGR